MEHVASTHRRCPSSQLLQNWTKTTGRKENNNTIFVSKPRINPGQFSRLFYYGFIATAAVLCSLNSVGGEFVHDDLVAITRNKDVSGPGDTSWSSIWKHDFWGRPLVDPKSHKSFRPLTTITFRLNYLHGALRPSSYHIVNILLHACVTLLFTLVCERVVALKTRTAALAGLTFAIHPVHCEAVAGIVGRAELLSAFFFFLSILCYYRSVQTSPRSLSCTGTGKLYSAVILLLSLTLAGCATLAKEQGATVLGVLLIYQVFIVAPRIRSRSYNGGINSELLAFLKGPAIILYAGVVLVGFRLWLIGFQLPQFAREDNPANAELLLCTRVLSKLYVYCCNVWLLICPVTLSYDWQMGSIALVKSVFDVRNIASVSLVTALLAALWMCRKKSHTAHKRVVLLGLSLLIIPFLPAANVFFSVGFVMAERVLYIPSAGYCVLLAYGVELICSHIHRHKASMLAMMLLLQGFQAARTITRNTVWQSRETLFKSGLDNLPQNAKMHYNYGNVLKDLGGTYRVQAQKHYEMAIKLWPEYASAHNNLGTLVASHADAERLYKQAVELNPKHSGAYFNLGNLYLQQHNLTLSLTSLQQAVTFDPEFAEAYTSMALVLYDLGRFEEAEYCYRAAVTLKPDDPNVYNNLGVFLANRGDTLNALRNYRKAYKSDASHHIAMINAARLLHSTGKGQQAQQLFEKAVAVSHDPATLVKAGIFFYNTNQLKEAARLFAETVKKEPSNIQNYVYYAQTLAKQSNFVEAEIILHKAQQHSPDNINVLLQLANVLGLNAKHEQSIELLTAALNSFENSKRTNTNYRNVHSTMHRSPTLPIVSQEVYDMQLQQGTTEGCSNTMKECIAHLHFCLANHHKDIGNLQEAFQHYHISAELDPSNSEAHLNLGVFYHLEEKASEARFHYEQAHRLDPFNPLVEENLKKLQATAYR